MTGARVSDVHSESAGVAGENAAVPDCWLCAVERDERESDIWNRWANSRMYVCPTCGNKRCPKATDHRLDCTGSNEQGQAGSRCGGLTSGQIGSTSLKVGASTLKDEVRPESHVESDVSGRDRQ